MTTGATVKFPREETLTSDEGRYLGKREWVQAGEVTEVLPSGRLRVAWVDPVWGPTQMICYPEELLAS